MSQQQRPQTSTNPSTTNYTSTNRSTTNPIANPPTYDNALNVFRRAEARLHEFISLHDYLQQTNRPVEYWREFLRVVRWKIRYLVLYGEFTTYDVAYCRWKLENILMTEQFERAMQGLRGLVRERMEWVDGGEETDTDDW
ncbi:MAG: hypothetical protein M1831_000983 [Alyxoria varia]|nr:MAG: hypothetical protein M1831_000983 [Alyxoria varia]